MLPLARSLARRYANKGEPLDDLEQVACVGLIKAIDRFDLEPRRALRDLRGPDDRRRAQAPLPRPRLDDARPARGPGAQRRRSAGRRASGCSRDLSRSPTVAELARAARRRRGAACWRRSPPPRPTARSRSTSRSAGRHRRRWRRSAATTAASSAPRRGAMLADGLEALGAARARDRAPALLRGPHPARDRRAHRHLADARLAADPPHGASSCATRIALPRPLDGAPRGWRHRRRHDGADAAQRRPRRRGRGASGSTASCSSCSTSCASSCPACRCCSASC